MNINFWNWILFQVHEFKVGKNQINSKMEIDPTTQRDSGYYECQADNKYAIDKRGFRTDFTLDVYWERSTPNFNNSANTNNKNCSLFIYHKNTQLFILKRKKNTKTISKVSALSFFFKKKFYRSEFVLVIKFPVIQYTHRL